jgi:hypothetical protein
MWICAIGLTLSLGCTTAVVRPYIGEQQAWPIANGSIVNMKYGYPIFTSLPPSPYEVIGELRIESPLYAQPEEGHMPVLIKKAEELDADALVFVEGNIYFSTNYGPRPGADVVGGTPQPTLTQVNRFNPDSFKPNVTILAIRWIGEPPPGLTSKKQEEEAAKAAQEEMAAPVEAAAPEMPAEPTPPAAEEVAPEAAPVTPPAEEALVEQPTMEGTPATETAPVPSEVAPTEAPPVAEQPVVEPTPAPETPAEPAPIPTE